MNKELLAERREEHRRAIREERPHVDRHILDASRFLRDAVVVQSARALDMAKAAGLGTPCARQTT